MATGKGGETRASFGQRLMNLVLCAAYLVGWGREMASSGSVRYLGDQSQGIKRRCPMVGWVWKGGREAAIIRLSDKIYGLMRTGGCGGTGLTSVDQRAWPTN